MKKIILIILAIFFFGLGAWFAVHGLSSYQARSAEREKIGFLNREVEWVLDSRRDETEKGEPVDPFGEDGAAKVLLIGLDRRAGDAKGHCDAIQLITIDKNKQSVTITAVPRGTYSPLPPGGAHPPSDYYIAKACAIGGLEYGIRQIEKIFGAKADYLVVLGFSEALGIFRNLDLPATETLQWLRQRHGYAVGEPQRAHNHSMFLKQMMMRFVPQESSKMNMALEYILYKMVKTDMSFAEVRVLTDALSAMDFINHPERIRLTMRPAYVVQDIPYAEEHLGEYLDVMINPIKDLLSKDDYSGITEGAAQAKLLEIIDEKKNDPEFISWVFENNLWLQIEDSEKRLAIQHDFLTRYLLLLSEKDQRESVITDYILEMEYYGENQWAGKGKDLLVKEIGQ